MAAERRAERPVSGNTRSDARYTASWLFRSSAVQTAYYRMYYRHRFSSSPKQLKPSKSSLLAPLMCERGFSFDYLYGNPGGYWKSGENWPQSRPSNSLACVHIYYPHFRELTPSPLPDHVQRRYFQWMLILPHASAGGSWSLDGLHNHIQRPARHPAQ